jgi:hypothetical protein
MSTVRLNRRTIVQGLVPPESERHGRDGLSPDLAFVARELTRREAVMIMGGAAAAIACGPLVRTRPLPAPEVGSFAGAAWLRAGRFDAVLDPARFGGVPRLLVSAAVGWRALLTGATFPGTGLPADMELSTLGSGAATRLGIRMALGGFDADVPLAMWLAGDRVAKSQVCLDGLAMNLGPDSALVLNGPATATLAAKDWTLRLEGSGIARVKDGTGELVSDVVTVSLAPASLPSMFSRKISRRAVLELERGDREWSVSPPASSEGAVSFSSGAFDRLTLEAAETAAGAMHRALVASGGDGSTGAYTVAGATVPLTDVRYARLLDDGSFHVAGQFTDWLSWMHGGSGALLVGAADWAPPFEMEGGTAGTKVTCNPAVFGVVAPFGDVIAAPLTFPSGARRVAALGTSLSRRLKPLAVVAPAAAAPPIILPDHTSVTVTRPDDLLTLTFRFFNFTYTTVGGPKLVRTNNQYSSYISVEFPPQNFLERAFFEGTETPATPPIQSFITDPSRLAFKVADATADAGIPYTLEGLLDWSDFTHSVVPAANDHLQADPAMRAPGVGGQVVGAPAPPETSLEVPWGLYMSPSAGEWWKHKTAPATLASRTELWHTRLHGEMSSVIVPTAAPGPGPGPGPGPIVSVEGPVTLRAVWARYYDSHLADANPPPEASDILRNDFTTSASGILRSGVINRWAIVDLTARYRDNPMTMRNMMLSPLGAWFDGRGEWDYDHLRLEHPQIAASILEWDHRATMGRDHYVKIVQSGRLFPFGHAAALITITERKFKTKNGRRYAYLMQKQFIKVREPVKTYNFPSNGVRDRLFPFKKIEMKTLVTPPLMPVEHAPIGSQAAGLVFWPETLATNSRTLFQIEGTDWDGNVVKFDAPLIYMDTKLAVGGGTPADESGGNIGATLANLVYRTVRVDMAGQRIAFAQKPADTSKGDERTLPTRNMYFDIERRDPPASGEIRFYPRMYRAGVGLETVERLTGSSTGTDIVISDQYRDSGFGGPNAQGMVFARIVTPSSPTFPGALAGGLATPIPLFSGIGATMGAIGGKLDQVAGGTFDPIDYFNQVMDTELLGGITLKDLLETGLSLVDMPTFKQIPVPDIPDQISIQFDWSTTLTKPVLVFAPIVEKGCQLKLHAEVRQSIKVPPDPPSFAVTAELTNFRLEMVPSFPCLNLVFETLKFESLDGASPDVTPMIIDVEFVGALSYLSEIAKYLGALGGGSGAAALATTGQGDVHALTTIVDSGPLKIDVDGSGIKASLNIALPDIAIGVFSLKNMSFGAALKIPFTGGSVTLDFNFCSRQSPFELLVMGFGGGGYVLITFDSIGIVMLEISLEFGAGISFGIGGIASGMVEIKGGLMIRWDRLPEGDKLSFMVFIRIAGALDILGLIKVSLTFYLELLYETLPEKLPPGDKLTGTATLTIEITILFFTIPVELSVTKELAGKDPRFGELMPVQEDWDAYCEAFAPANLGA